MKAILKSSIRHRAALKMSFKDTWKLEASDALTGTQPKSTSLEARLRVTIAN